jgi:hypothetical protein
MIVTQGRGAHDAATAYGGTAYFLCSLASAAEVARHERFAREHR